MLNRQRLICIHLLCFVSLFSCASWESHQGVKNVWRDDTVAQFEVGKTTQSQVTEILGPPSQIIGLGDRMIFYYLLESTKSEGLFLIIYNRADKYTIYDRAIFFFNKKGILTEYAYSPEQVTFKE